MAIRYRIAEAKPQRVAASYLEAIGAIDLRQFPRPDGAANVDVSVLRLGYDTSTTSDAAVDFCTSFLSSAGWEHNTKWDKRSGRDRFLYFEKDCFFCELFVDPALLRRKVRVTIENHGNIDARELPRMADAKFKFESATSVFYSTNNSAEKTVKYLLSELEKDGWVRYVQQEHVWNKEATQGAFWFFRFFGEFRG